MNRKEYFFILIVAVFFGFIGGFVSNKIFVIEPAEARKANKVISAGLFEVVDNSGNVRARLGTRNGLTYLSLGSGSPSNITLGAYPNNLNIYMNNPKGNGIVLDSAVGKTPSISIRSKGKIQASLPDSSKTYDVKRLASQIKAIKQKLDIKVEPLIPLKRPEFSSVSYGSSKPISDGSEERSDESSEVWDLQQQLDSIWVNIDMITNKLNELTGQ